jgi:hypothetical protein
MFRFTNREVLLLMVAFGMGLGWLNSYRMTGRRLGLIDALKSAEHDVSVTRLKNSSCRVRIVCGNSRSEDGRLQDVEPLSTHTYTLNNMGDLVNDEWELVKQLNLPATRKSSLTPRQTTPSPP